MGTTRCLVVLGLKFGLLFGWMNDVTLALGIALTDWLAGYLIYRWKRGDVEIVRVIPNEIDPPLGSPRNEPTELAA
jgi:hypothetical protein